MGNKIKNLIITKEMHLKGYLSPKNEKYLPICQIVSTMPWNLLTFEKSFLATEKNRIEKSQKKLSKNELHASSIDPKIEEN